MPEPEEELVNPAPKEDEEKVKEKVKTIPDPDIPE